MAIIAHLIVNTYGSFVGKHQGRLVVTCGKDKLAEAPLMHLETVLLDGHGVSISTDALLACAEYGIPVYILDSQGAPRASFYASALIGTVQTRRAQLLAYYDGRGVEVARHLALGKIRNQATLLKYVAKYRKEQDPALYEALREAAIAVLEHEREVLALQAERVDAIREALLGIEGRAAQVYWQALGRVVPAALAWPGRQTREATDPFNMALNYGYGVLYGQVERVCVLAGLDPYGGFLHTDRPGKPSLVLDLIEPYRPAVVDRTVLAMVTRGTALKLDEAGRLQADVRRTIAEKVYERLDAPAPYQGKKLSLNSILQLQARTLAVFLRGEQPHFEAYVADW
jgi:CRISPR-associated protein Cas1